MAVIRSYPKLASEIPKWLEQWAFSRLVTLTFNDPAASTAKLAGSTLNYGFLRERLRKWDAFMNRALVGRDWALRPEDRMFAFYTLEKPLHSPHWHGLVRFFETEDRTEAWQKEVFDREAEPNWKKLVPTGTVDVQAIYNQIGASEYIVKTLGYELQFEHFIVPDEFERG